MKEGMKRRMRHKVLRFPLKKKRLYQKFETAATRLIVARVWSAAFATTIACIAYLCYILATLNTTCFQLLFIRVSTPREGSCNEEEGAANQKCCT
jgi:hypothetical protein